MDPLAERMLEQQGTHALETVSVAGFPQQDSRRAPRNLAGLYRQAMQHGDWISDEQSMRKDMFCGTIEQGPFYAAHVYPGNVGTYGGVVIDVHARVLREDGTVIEGLYATGVSTASVMGRFYPGAGSSVGPSFVFGYIAARHAINGLNAINRS